MAGVIGPPRPEPGVRPTTPTEATVLGAAEQVLGRPGIALDDDVFDLGISSLRFIQLLVRINEVCGVALTGAELGDGTTIRELAQQVDKESRAHGVHHLREVDQ